MHHGGCFIMNSNCYQLFKKTSLNPLNEEKLLIPHQWICTGLLAFYSYQTMLKLAVLVHN